MTPRDRFRCSILVWRYNWERAIRALVATPYRAYLTGLAAGALLALSTAALIYGVVETIR